MILRVISKAGKLSDRSIADIQEKVATLGDGLLEIRIDRIPNNRVSERLRRYYWSLCRLIAQYLTQTGYKVSEHDIHADNAKKYMSLWFMNYNDMTTYQDRFSHIFMETSNLKIVCEQLQQFWSERGLYLPDPHEDSYDFDQPPATPQ